MAQIWLHDYGSAAGQLAAARELFAAVDDRIGLAATHRVTARMLGRQNRHADVLVHDERALTLFRGERHLAGQARVLNAIGWHHAHLGRPEAAIEVCRRAAVILGDLGHPDAAVVLRQLGRVDAPVRAAAVSR